MGLLKKIWSYLWEKLDLNVIPSADKEIRTYSIRRIIPLTFIIIIIISITTLSYLYKHYEKNYLAITVRLNELKGVRAENQRLKNELYMLTQDTERLKENLSRLEEHNKEIKNMIELEDADIQAGNETIDLELHTYMDYNNNIIQQGLPIGGGALHLAYHPPDELLDQARENINMLKKELPDQKKDMNNLEDSVREYNDLQAATPKIWPLADKGDAYISSNFGWRSDPFTGEQQFHEGLDIGVWYNTPVLATADGVIDFVGRNGGYGLLVVIDHGFGFETRYAHLNKVKVKKGQRVKRQDVIGLSGNSGRSNGPHLHYEVRTNNIPQNPSHYLGR